MSATTGCTLARPPPGDPVVEAGSGYGVHSASTDSTGPRLRLFHHDLHGLLAGSVFLASRPPARFDQFFKSSGEIRPVDRNVAGGIEEISLCGSTLSGAACPVEVFDWPEWSVTTSISRVAWKTAAISWLCGCCRVSLLVERNGRRPW
jgi:hypothetical protein